MDRREKDERLDALMVGGWVDRDKKMDGWMDDIYIYIYGWLKKKQGWLHG